MPHDPLARDLLLSLTARLRRRAQGLLDPPGEAARPALDDSTLFDTGEAGPDTALVVLAQSFQLTPLEYAVLLSLLAAEIEPYFRLLIRAHQREGGRPWLELGTIADLLGLDATSLPDLFELFLPDGKLRSSGLVLVDEATGVEETPLIHLRAKAPRSLLRHVLGEQELPQGMRLCSQPRPILGQSLVAPTVRDELLARVRYAILQRQPLVIALNGVDGVGKKFFAEGIAAELGRSLLFVDLRSWFSRSPATEHELSLHLADVTREMTLANALPYFDGWDALLDQGITQIAPPASIDSDEARPSQAAMRPLPSAFGRYLERCPEVAFLGARERYVQLDRLATSVTHLSVAFPGPAQRGLLWQRAIAAGGASLAAGIDADELGRKFALDPARIFASTHAATELATLRRPGGAVVLGRDEIFAASRQQLQHELASLALRVTKAHRWEDLVIPVDVYEGLQELLSYLRHGPEVYEQQGFAARHSITPGLSALFAGDPGTGKTMCASIIARELEMELFQVDLSRIVSKWVGETEKNLAKVFDEAQRSHAVILFDEADSLFARRTEVKSSIDRYANLEVSYLLQRMEQFPGVTILTTNFEDAIDPAFKRRITFKMRFERPDEDARAALWRKMFPPQAVLDEDVDCEEVARRYDLSGGSIRNAAIRAAFLAAVEGKSIHQKHLLTAAAREAREQGALVTETRRQATASDDEADAPDAPPRRPPARTIPVTHPRR